MAHIHELIDFVVNAFITNNDKVLLILHKKLNMWLPIGGHIELDEDPEQALFREIKEECGLDVEIVRSEKPVFKSNENKPIYPPVFVDIHKVSENHKHICLNYFATAKSDKVILNKEEHNDIRWFNEKELDEAEFGINEAIKLYAKEALKNSVINL